MQAHSVGCLGRPYDNYKNPYRYRDHQRRSEGKKTVPDRADVGRRQKRVLPQRNRAPSLCRKYAPPAAAGHHQAYRGEACLNRTKNLSLKLLSISRAPAGVCSCRKPKRALKKIALYSDDDCDAAVLNAAFAQALYSHSRASFFRASQRNCMRGYLMKP